MITIGKKDYELIFDFDFMRKANEKFGIKRDGVNIKNGIAVSMLSIVSDDIETIMDYIKLAAKPVISYNAIENHFAELMMKDDDGKELHEFIDDVKEEIKAGLTTRDPFKKTVKMAEKGQKALEAQQA